MDQIITKRSLLREGQTNRLPEVGPAYCSSLIRLWEFISFCWGRTGGNVVKSLDLGHSSRGFSIMLSKGETKRPAIRTVELKTTTGEAR
jgi:hypothetical protein